MVGKLKEGLMGKIISAIITDKYDPMGLLGTYEIFKPKKNFKKNRKKRKVRKNKK